MKMYSKVCSLLIRKLILHTSPYTFSCLLLGISVEHCIDLLIVPETSYFKIFFSGTHYGSGSGICWQCEILLPNSIGWLHFSSPYFPGKQMMVEVLLEQTYT